MGEVTVDGTGWASVTLKCQTPIYPNYVCLAGEHLGGAGVPAGLPLNKLEAPLEEGRQH